MKATYKKLAIIVTVTTLLSSCYWHNWENIHPNGHVSATPCVLADTISYTHDVAPILNASCGTTGSQASSCHGVGGSGSNYSDWSSFSGNTCPDSTCNVYYDITWDPINAPHNMPLGGSKLSQCDINKIIRWMDQGAKNN